MVFEVITKERLCEICDSIQRKNRRYWKAQEELDKWTAENRLEELEATVMRTREHQEEARQEIKRLQARRLQRAQESREQNEARSATAGPSFNVNRSAPSNFSVGESEGIG